MMKKSTIYNLFFIWTLLFGSAFYAQTVTGVVSDANGGLPGANVVIKGTTLGTATDFDGNYTLQNVDAKAVLVFSMIGFNTKEINVNGQSVINVVLSEDSQSLDEVVLVGYSSRKKSTLTGAVAVVDMADLERARVTNVAQALQGQVAGVQVTSSTGAPGDPIEVHIRGEGTIGNNNPLYVVDGIPSRDISFLNQADIKTMTVLKDASAAAIYGSRASGGVVLITTKSGVKGKTSFDVNYYTGVHNASNLPNLLNAEQYINTVEKAWDNSTGLDGTNPYTADKGRADFSDTDWLNELFETGRSQNLQFTASGGGDKVQFLMSLGYYEQDGIVIFNNDKYQKLNYRTNINAQLTDRFKIGTNLQLSYATQDALSSKGDAPGIIRHALIRPPVIGVYKDVNDPTYSVGDPFTDLPFYVNNNGTGVWDRNYEESQNPIALANFTDDVRKDFRTFGNVYGEYAFLKDKELTFRTNLGIDLSFIHNKTFGKNFGDDNDNNPEEADPGLGRQNKPDNLSEERGEARTITFNNTLNYVKTFNEKHDVSLLVGTEYIDNYSSSIGASRFRFPYTFDTFRYLDYGLSDRDLWNGGSASEWTLFSLFGSASYVFADKYMVTANMRADASSRFSEKNRWGYFPSVSAGWKISDENFMKDVNWISNLKLRAGWGEAGNQEIDNYAFLTLISQRDGKIKTDRYGNEDVKWESSESTNIGVDLGLLDNKLAISADYFVKNTSDILLPIGLPSIVGDVAPTIVNAGEVSNKGFEFSVNYRNSDSEFKYSVNANLGTSTNNVEKLHPNLPNLSGDVTKTEVGHSLNAYYGYKMVGIYQNQAEIDSYLSSTPELDRSKPGDIKFKDVNGDGKIDSADRAFLGDPIPDITYGLSFSANYKGFDFSFLFQGVEGVDRYNDSKKILDYDSRPFNYTTNILSAWDGEGSSNTIPRVTFNDNGSSKVSSIFVEDASYLRLKNIEIGYTLKSLKVIQDIRFYLSGQNLFTATDYTGLDPESTDLIDRGTYPSSKSFLFGVNVKF